MRTLIWIIALLLPLSVFSQDSTKTQYNLNVAIGTFTATGTADWQGNLALVGSSTYSIDSIQVGYILFDSYGNKYRIEDDSIVVSGFIVRVDVSNIGGTAKPFEGRGALYAPSENLKLNIIPPNGSNYITEQQESQMMTDNWLMLDSLIYNFALDTAYANGDTIFLIFPGGDTTTVTLDLAFDSNRNILRVPTIGTNIGGSSIKQWLEWWYFTAPTLSISGMTTPIQVGTSQSYTISGSTTNPGSATLSGGVLRRTSPGIDTLDNFGAGTSYSASITFTPQQGGTGTYNELSYSFQARQNWVFGAESGLATSSTRTIQGVYPVLYGMSATDFSVGGDPYTLTKLVQTEGNKTVTLTGSGFIYYLVPKTWGDFTLSQIIDHNGFNVTSSFTAYDVLVSSSGLLNDWVDVPYKMYKLNTTTTTLGYAYQFIR